MINIFAVTETKRRFNPPPLPDFLCRVLSDASPPLYPDKEQFYEGNLP